MQIFRSKFLAYNQLIKNLIYDIGSQDAIIVSDINILYQLFL